MCRQPLLCYYANPSKTSCVIINQPKQCNGEIPVQTCKSKADSSHLNCILLSPPSLERDGKVETPTKKRKFSQRHGSFPLVFARINTPGYTNRPGLCKREKLWSLYQQTETTDLRLLCVWNSPRGFDSKFSITPHSRGKLTYVDGGINPTA